MLTEKIKGYFSKFGTLVIIIIMFLLICMAYNKCNKPANTYISNHTDTVDYKTKHINDSVSYVEIAAKLVDSKTRIKELEDAYTRKLVENSKLQSTGIISWRERIEYRDLSVNYDSAISSKAAIIIKQQQTLDSLRIGDNFISVPRTFSFSNEWISEKGTIKKNGVDINSVQTFTSPVVIFGEKRKRFIGIPVSRPIVTTIVGDKNPYASQTDVKSFQYKPKQSKFSLVVGTGVGYDFTNKVKFIPIQATFGIRIF